MKRRVFTSLLGTAAAMAVTSCSPKLTAAATPAVVPQRIKPKRLSRGDLVSLISPGSYIDDEGLERAVSNLETLGFRVKLGKHIRALYGYVAGTDEQRLEDLHAAFRDREVQAVWCVRGGYGCSRLLPAINYDLIRKNPKALIGYSDITALLTAIYYKTGLVGFHGPVGSSKLTDYNQMHLEAVLMEGISDWVIQRPETYRENNDPAFVFETLRSGRAEGILLGGNLSLLAAMSGTDYLPQLDDYLVFIEEVGEKPYRVDRMMTQLRQANALSRAQGLALGVFSGCGPDAGSRSLTLSQTLHDRLEEMKYPISYGLPFGHITDQCTLPVGIQARLDADRGMLTLLESAVL